MFVVETTDLRTLHVRADTVTRENGYLVFRLLGAGEAGIQRIPCNQIARVFAEDPGAGGSLRMAAICREVRPLN